MRIPMTVNLNLDSILQFSFYGERSSLPGGQQLLSGQGASLLAQAPVNTTRGTGHISPWLNSIGEHSPRILHLVGIEYAIETVVEHVAIKSFPVVATAIQDTHPHL